MIWRVRKEQYKENLHILIMDIGDSESVVNARKQLYGVEHLDLLINNAVTVSEDCDKEFFDVNLDNIAHTVDVTAVGALIVIQVFYDLLVATEETPIHSS